MNTAVDLPEAVLTELPSEVAVIGDEAFDAGVTTGDGDGNTGLGLSIAESIADAHGWQVRVTDGRDGGARFEVRT